MTIFVATSASDSGLVMWVVLAVVLGVGWYLLACALFPWRACRWCEGGKQRDASRKHWRECWHCGGSGRKARVGRKVLKGMAPRRGRT